MGLPENQSPPQLYSQEIQLKLYQAFIFSIPILFAIILFLLFYLFYLKRRSFALSSPPPILPMVTFRHPTSFVGMKGEQLKHKLPIVLFDEDLRIKESQCCVCLGEFEMKEELQQVPSCKHVFHADCIGHWLHFYSNSTCPLCRSPIDDAPPSPPAHAALICPSPPSLPPPPLLNSQVEQSHRRSNDFADHHRVERPPCTQQPELDFGSSSTNETS